MLNGSTFNNSFWDGKHVVSLMRFLFQIFALENFTKNRHRQLLRTFVGTLHQRVLMTELVYGVYKEKHANQPKKHIHMIEPWVMVQYLNALSIEGNLFLSILITPLQQN